MPQFLYQEQGTYLLDPAAWDYIPQDRRFDMTDLIRAMLEAESESRVSPSRSTGLMSAGMRIIKGRKRTC